MSPSDPPAHADAHPRPEEPARPAGRARGYLEVLLAASLWGSSGIFATHLFRMGMGPESVALLRPLVGAAFLAGAAAVWARAAFRIERRGLLVILAWGGLATAAFQLAYQMSMEAVGVPATVALLYLAPALVLAAAGPLLGEWPSPARVGFAALSVGGVWLTVLHVAGAAPRVTPAGAAWGLLAAASYAGYTLFGRYATPRWGAMATVLHSTLGACALLLVVLPLARRPLAFPPTSAAWGLLALFGLLTIALATFLFYDGLGRVEAGPASVTTTVEPVVAALLATWLLGQGLEPLGWLGLALVVTGVAGSYLTGASTAGGEPRRRPSPTQE